MSTTLSAVIAELSRTQARVLVAIDGPDGAGKTTLADDLATRIGSAPVRASVDSFHRPRLDRYQRGLLSAEGYYLDSFDYEAMTTQCLYPFRDGAARVATASYDYRSEVAQGHFDKALPPAAVLVVDGVFLLRERLRTLWTLSVYLRVSDEEVLRRALRRDVELFGSAEEVERRYRGRYLPGQNLYRQDASPEDIADIVINNEDPAKPVILRVAKPFERLLA